jgi:hypothetical protein
MKSIIQIISVFLMPALFLTGCGDLKIGDKVQLRLDPATQTANLEVEMSDGLQVSLNGDFPIADGKGRLYFVDATKTTNAKIGVEVNLAVLAGSTVIHDIGTISTLPNGAALPVAMTPPLMTIPVVHNANYNLDAAFTLTPDVQIAALIGIKQFSAKYVPAGVAVCQNFRNADNLAFAAVCLYGASADGKSGGIFVGADMGPVLDLNGIIPSNPQRNSVSLMASSAPFTLDSRSLNFQARSTTSTKFDSSIVDPRRDLQGNKGIKAWNNVQKVLSVRR